MTRHPPGRDRQQPTAGASVVEAGPPAVLDAQEPPRPHLGFRLQPDGSAAEPVFASPGVPVLVVGPTASGKTFYVCSHLAKQWSGSLVATSGKTDLLPLTLAHRGTLGPTWTLDPAGVTGRPADGLDLLAWCRTYDDANEIAGMLVDYQSRGNTGVQDAAFWYSNARRLLAVDLFAAGANGYSFDDVYRWVMTEEAYEVRALLQATGHEAAQIQFEAIESREDRLRSSIIGTTQQTLTPYDRDSARRAVSGGAIHLDTLLGLHKNRPLGDLLQRPGTGPWDLRSSQSSPHTLYLVLPAHHLADFGALVALLLHRLVREARNHETTGTPLPSPTMLLIDEAGLASGLPLQEWTTTLRSSGLQLVTAFQSLGQIDAMYGPTGTDVLLENSTCVLLGGARPTPTTRRLATWLVGQPATLLDAEAKHGQTLTLEDAARGLAQLPLGHAVVLDGPRVTAVRLPQPQPERTCESA